MALSTGISSDNTVALRRGHSEQCHLSPSFSMPDLNGLGLGHKFGGIWSPNLLSGSLFEHVQAHHPRVSTFVTAFNALRLQFFHLKHRIYDMEAENNELMHANVVLRSDSQALEQELSNLRADYYAERFQSKVRIQCARADKDKIIILTDKLEQAEKFIMAMVDIKLHEPVLGRAAEAVKEGADAEEALIDAVRVAATKKGSAWSRIIPAIVGPRSPEHYLSAINFALMLQKDLHEREKVASFWKTIAKLDPVNAHTITPSSSLLSEVGGEDVQHSISEQAVLDEMIAFLTNGDTLCRNGQPVYSAEVVASDLILTEDKITVASIPIGNSSIIQPEAALRAKPISPILSPSPTASITTLKSSVIQPEVTSSAKPISPVSYLPTIKEGRTQVTPLSKTPKLVRVSQPIHKSQIPVSPLRSKIKPSEIAQSKLPSPVSPLKVPSSPSPASPSIVSLKKPFTPIRKVPSTPIRSRLSTPRTNTFKRPALTTIDLNKPAKTDTPRKLSNVSDRNRSKSLEKRRGVIMEEISHPPPSIVTKNENTFLPMTAEIEIYKPRTPSSPTCISKITETNNPASPSISPQSKSIHIPPISPVDKESSFHCTESDLSSENAVPGSLLTIQALLSLERICAAFSSDSLGSLEMSDEGADCGDDLQSGAQDGLPHRPSTPIVKCSPWASSPKPSPTYSTKKLAKSVKDTFYNAVPPLRNQNNGSQQPLLPLQDKASQAIFPENLDTSSPVGRQYIATTISSPAKPRSNTLDSYLQVPSKNVKGTTRTKVVSLEVDDTVPTAAFMRRPDVKTTSENTRKMTSSAASTVPLVPNWCPSLPGSDLSPTQYRNMLRNGANMGIR